MLDLIDQLFDLDVPLPDTMVLARQAPNLPRLRTRLLERLREVHLPVDRLPTAAVVLRYWVPRLAKPLREVCADADAPLLNRALAAHLLLEADLDPQVPAERLPVLAEGILLAAAAIGGLDRVGRIVAVLCAQPRVDVTELLRRLDRWRYAAALPGHQLYALLLSSEDCAAVHAQVHAGLAHEIAPIAVPNPALSGRAWVGESCDHCGGRQVWALVETGDGFSTGLRLHLSDDLGEGAEILSLLDVRTRRMVVEEAESSPFSYEVPLGALAVTAFDADSNSNDDERALWLLRQVPPAAYGMSQAYAVAIAGSTEGLDATLASLATDPPDPDALAEALDELVVAAAASVFQALGVPDDPRDLAPWLALFAAVVKALEGYPARWGQELEVLLTYAWSDIEGGLCEGQWVDSDGEAWVQGLVDLLPRQRRDQLVWREVLACALADALNPDPVPEWDEHQVVVAIRDHHAAVERFGFTPRDVARDLGAPATFADDLAGILAIGADDPLTSSTRVEVEAEDDLADFDPFDEEDDASDEVPALGAHLLPADRRAT